MTRTRAHRGLLAAALGLAASLTFIPAAGAATADVSLTGGILEFTNSTPADVTFPTVALTGSDQVTSRTQPIDISDARGSGAGWNITATSTLFTNGTDELPAAATTLAVAPATACETPGACTLPTPSGITYPYTLPADTAAPIATRMFNASTTTGLGSQRITPDWQLKIPGSARTGSYTSTWTFSLTSGP